MAVLGTLVGVPGPIVISRFMHCQKTAALLAKERQSAGRSD